MAMSNPAMSSPAMSAPGVSTPAWLLLVVTLPTTSGTARMRVWRALKAMGCAALRDGAYLLPTDDARAQALRDLGEECIAEGGTAWLMTVAPISSDEAAAYLQLFDRTEQYAELRTGWKHAARTLSSLSTAELSRLRKRSQKEMDA